MIREELMIQAAKKGIARIASHATLYKGTIDEIEVYEPDDMIDMFKLGAEWSDEHPRPIWKDAQGEDLPEIDREVIVIDKMGKVSFGHRPNPQGYYGKNLTTGEEVRKYRYEVQTYDKGGWNFPDVRWWLDAPMPEGLEDLK